MRLQKFLAETGLGSRRSCEELIRMGRVKVDGRPASIGASVDPDTQVVEVDGRQVTREAKEYWLLNKPPGVLSAARDARGRRTVVGLVPSAGRVFPVGRLDLESTGLLVLTNDGDLAARLLHPRYHVEREYVVTVRGVIDERTLARLKRGVDLEDGVSTPSLVEMVDGSPAAVSSGSTVLRLVMREGRKRQVRRTLEAVGYRVAALHRSRFGALTDSGLELGQARRLSPEEVEQLRRAPVGL